MLNDSSLYEDIVPKIQNVYNACSAAEQKQSVQILHEIADKGYSETLENVWLVDFKEMPVSIDQFTCDPLYLGETNDNGNTVYPFWKQTLRDIFNNGNKYNEIILSGATRIGKSSTAVTIMAYMLYRLMLYRDPHRYFNKKAISKFTLAFANLTKDLAEGVAFHEFNSTLQKSKWFYDRGAFTRSISNPVYMPEGNMIEILPASDAAHLLGLQTWCCTMDETNFAKAGIKDINKAKVHMKHLYDTVNVRISNTFRLRGEVYGKLVAASSKNTDSDFLSDHIEKQLNAGNDHLYLVDQPQWKILPRTMFSDKTFHFTVGDRFKKGFVIPEENDDESHRQEYIDQGYQIMEAPLEYKKNFLADYDISLRDIAGISVAGAMGFITQEAITPCVAQDRVNPFFEDTYEIGTRDTLQIYDFFHTDVVPRELFRQRMNIHLDLAETGDRSGMSGCCVSGSKLIETEEGKKVVMPFVSQIFQVGIVAPRGDRQSFQKVVNFIVWLRSQGFWIGTISTDQFQSDFLRETLSQQGFETTKISVDRSMEPYVGLRSMLHDQRISLVKHALQEDELVKLQRINNKIDHPQDGSKDCADALCGATWTLVTEQVVSQPSTKGSFAAMAAVNAGRGRSSVSGHSPLLNTPATTPSALSSSTIRRPGMIVLPRH